MFKFLYKPLSVTVLLRGSMLFLLMSSVAARVKAVEPQAQDLLKKMNALYASNTFQGSASVTQKGFTDDNKPYLTKGTQEVTYKSPNLFLIKTSGDAVGGTQVRIFDGKQIINYNSVQKLVTKRPVKGTIGENIPLPLLNLLGISIDTQGGKITGSAAVGGRAAYLIATSVPLPALSPGATAEEKASREEFKKSLPLFELAIDKKDCRLLRMVQTFKDPKMTRTLEFTQQTFNAVLGENAFAFAPPSGAQSQEASLKAAFKKGLKEINGASPSMQPSTQGQQTKTNRGGGNPFPAPHASPGAGGAGLHP